MMKTILSTVLSERWIQADIIIWAYLALTQRGHAIAQGLSIWQGITLQSY